MQGQMFVLAGEGWLADIRRDVTWTLQSLGHSVLDQAGRLQPDILVFWADDRNIPIMRAWRSSGKEVYAISNQIFPRGLVSALAEIGVWGIMTDDLPHFCKIAFGQQSKKLPPQFYLFQTGPQEAFVNFHLDNQHIQQLVAQGPSAWKAIMDNVVFNALQAVIDKAAPPQPKLYCERPIFALTGEVWTAACRETARRFLAEIASSDRGTVAKIGQPYTHAVMMACAANEPSAAALRRRDGRTITVVGVTINDKPPEVDMAFDEIWCLGYQYRVLKEYQAVTQADMHAAVT